MIKVMTRKKRGFRRKAVVSLLVLLIVGSSAGYALAKPLPAPVLEKLNVTVAATKATALSWPTYGESAVSAVGYGVLATNGAQLPLATASITKVLTALSVLKQKPLQNGEAGPTITIDATDVASYDSYAAQDGSVVPVAIGEQISEYQALQALLLPSANNMADTLARWAFGSVDSYLAFANSYAQQLGLTSFHAADDASGFSAGTVASATDLAQLGMTALQNPVLASIVNQSTADIPVAGQIQNVNFLLGSHGIVGIKTGNNDVDLGAFLFAAKHTVSGHELTIVGAVMGAPSLPVALRDAATLADSATANFSATPLISPNTTVANYRAPWLKTPVAVTTGSGASPIRWGAEQTTGTVQLNRLSIPAKAGTPIGTLVFESSLTKQKTPVVLKLAKNVPDPSLWWRLVHIF